MAMVLNASNSKELLAEYAEECAIAELGEISPSRELYSNLEAHGMKTIAALDEGRLVGFATLLTYMVPHYGKKVAATESIFVARGYRGKIGRRLLDFIEALARKEQCAAVFYSAPVGSRFAEYLRLSGRFRHSNEVYLCPL